MIKNMVVSLVLFLSLDTIWINLIAGEFYIRQLDQIGRFNEAGEFDLRIVPGLLVYVLMALAIEIFLFRNESIKTLRQYLVNGALLGLIIYGVFDLTNRAILDLYPMQMAIVDMIWGTLLFTTVAGIQHEIRLRLTFM